VIPASALLSGAGVAAGTGAGTDEIAAVCVVVVWLTCFFAAHPANKIASAEITIDNRFISSSMCFWHNPKPLELCGILATSCLDTASCSVK